MGLTGQRKTDYQREYMRKRRSNKKGLTKEERSNKEEGLITISPFDLHLPTYGCGCIKEKSLLCTKHDRL